MKKCKAKKINPYKLLRMIFIILVMATTMTAGIKSAAIGSPGDSYMILVVSKGDTLWDIAGKHRGGENTQKVLYEIMRLNKIDNPIIFPGQELKIPLK